MAHVKVWQTEQPIPAACTDKVTCAETLMNFALAYDFHCYGFSSYCKRINSYVVLWENLFVSNIWLNIFEGINIGLKLFDLKHTPCPCTVLFSVFSMKSLVMTFHSSLVMVISIYLIWHQTNHKTSFSSFLKLTFNLFAQHQHELATWWLYNNIMDGITDTTCNPFSFFETQWYL